jgi:hypothetical protein
MASQEGHIEVGRLLLQKGADIEAKDEVSTVLCAGCAGCVVVMVVRCKGVCKGVCV